MPIVCCTCLKSKCCHVEVTEVQIKEEVEKGTLFGTNVVQNTYVNINCHCGQKFNCKLGNIAVNNCKCNQKILSSKTKINAEEIYKYCGKYPQADCQKCKGNGEVKHKQFGRCTICDGTGGIICANCLGTGIYIDGTVVNKCRGSLRGDCHRGYEDICTLCNGRKSRVIGTVILSCKYCR